MSLETGIILNNRVIPVSNIKTAQPNSSFEQETLAFIQHWRKGVSTFTLTTSGSTGKPKEITLTREQLIASARRTINKLQLSNKDTALVCLDTKFIAGKMMLVRALEAHMNIVAVEPVADPLQKISEPVELSFTALVPLQLETILQNTQSTEKLNKFRSVIVGGAAASESLKSKIKDLSCSVYATYGMTETVSHIALQKLNGVDAQDYFETLPDIKIKVDDRDCLVIELPGFLEPIITNDIVKIINDTRFRVLGRHDNVINSGGIKLNPEIIEAKIESVLRQAGIQAPFFVTGVTDERLGQKLVLIIEHSKSEIDLTPLLKQALPAYAVPKQIVFTPSFIRTETQKINRAKTVESALKGIV